MKKEKNGRFIIDHGGQWTMLKWMVIGWCGREGKLPGIASISESEAAN